jgi:hypothetical protein
MFCGEVGLIVRVGAIVYPWPQTPSHIEPIREAHACKTKERSDVGRRLAGVWQSFCQPERRNSSSKQRRLLHADHALQNVRDDATLDTHLASCPPHQCAYVPNVLGMTNGACYQSRPKSSQCGACPHSPSSSTGLQVTDDDHLLALRPARAPFVFLFLDRNPRVGRRRSYHRLARRGGGSPGSRELAALVLTAWKALQASKKGLCA